MTTDANIPDTQWAVQLTAPDVLKLNTAKPVFRPGPTQLLVRVEAAGLCFSDLKLLKQFSSHARKSPVIRGLPEEVLRDIPSYAPAEQPTVPGHEAVVRIVAVGDDVKHCAVGERVLVQADWRALETAQANGAFGYNFEGGLQEYVLLDERVLIEPGTGERYLLPAQEHSSASALALVEPWACVEHSYVTPERRTIKPNGQLLVVVEPGCAVGSIRKILTPQTKPGTISMVSADDSVPATLREPGVQVTVVTDVASLPERGFDDIMYFGAHAETVEILDDKLADGGIFNVVQCGESFGRTVSIDIGRVHYGGVRWCGTTGDDASVSYRSIPESGELRDGDAILIVGAGGPMGQMHVVRCLCCGVGDISLTVGDLDALRLKRLSDKVRPLIEKHGVSFRISEPGSASMQQAFTYITLMAPVAGLVVEAVAQSSAGGRINIFAGIPAGTRIALDLDAYINRRLWMFGTSGSTVGDMQLVLDKVESGTLDTNYSVDAVSGMAGAVDGLRAVENHSVPGKIVVYPVLRGMGLVPLVELPERYPSVAALLRDGNWTKEAEEELLRVAR